VKAPPSPYPDGMPPPLFVRELTAAERAALRSGLRSPDAFTLRRSQVLLASAAGQKPSQIAAALGCATQTVRDAIRAFAADGMGCLTAKPSTPKTTHPAWDRTRDEDLTAVLHQSPRTFGKPTGLWTLALVAEVCHAKGWTTRRLTPEGVRQVLQRLGVGWKRAKHWITSPDPDYAKKKSCGTG
jgi:transposase